MNKKTYNTASVDATSFQSDFFRRATDGFDLLKSLFDTFDDVTFNIIDAEDRIVAFSRSNCANCNFASEAEVIGRRCQDIFPKVLADVYVVRNRQVRESGEPIINQTYTHSADRSTNVKIVSIFPVRDRRGKIIGTAAVHRARPSKEKAPDWYGNVQRAIAYIDAHYTERLKLSQLAVETELAPSTFSHSFKRIVGISPARYITTIRINHARELLANTDRTVLDIALACGFYDQSHFIRTFKSFRHMTPLDYRRKRFFKFRDI